MVRSFIKVDLIQWFSPIELRDVNIVIHEY
jgi:hypothetical protein